MNLQVNGQARQTPDGATVADLLLAMEIRTRGVAVEHNGRVVPRAEHATTPLAEGDTLEVVTLVGGG